jgi:hypothetical protein
MSKLNESEKITFDIVYLYRGTSPKMIELVSTDKQGRVSFIDNYGNRHERSPQGGETIATYDLSAVESQNVNGEIVQRVYKRVEYYPAELEKLLDSNTKINNLISRHAHDFLTTHSHVMIKDANGGNINPNQVGNTLYELRETTKLIKAEVTKNKLITKARYEADEMVENDPQSFIDFCYRYGIRPIEGVLIERLYNEVLIKINSNPQYFFDILEHKDAKLLTAIKMAMVGVGDEGALLEPQESYYTFNGEIVGQSDEEILSYFKNKPRERDILYKKLKLSSDDIVEIPTLPAESDAITSTEAEKGTKRRADVARINEMESDIKRTFNGWKLERAKGESYHAKAHERYTGILTKMREQYLDVVDAFDADVAKRMKYIK